MSAAQHTADIFKRLLTPLWLRPERALWDAHELYAVAKALGTMVSPSLEYGCTEGTNTFVMLGGEFDISYDEYDESLSTVDIRSKSDHFATHIAGKQATIRTHALQKFDIGVSWRESHIVKSSRLNLYSSLHCVDLGSPLTMIESESIQTLWSPNLYWNEGQAFTNLLEEHKRVLHSDGMLVTILPDTAQIECMFLPKLLEQPFEPIATLIDRGIYANTIRHAKNYQAWKEYFLRHNLVIEHHDRFLPTLVSQVYQIGFRPMFSVFKQMYDALLKHDPAALIDLKQHWIDTVFHFMSPLCDTKWMEKNGMQSGWHVFVLRKQRGTV